MNGDEYKRLISIGRKHAARLGLQHLADDIAQDFASNIALWTGQRDPRRLAIDEKRKQKPTVPIEPDHEPVTEPPPRITLKAKGRERAMVLLKYRWGLTVYEIGELFGIDGARAAAVIRETLKKERE